MAQENTNYGHFHDLYPDFRAVWIDREDLDIDVVREWMLDPARAGDFYISRTSARHTGLSYLVCLMSDHDTAFEYKVRWF